MTADFAIRPVTPGDDDALAEIFRRSIREIAVRDYSPAQIAAWSAHPDDKHAWSQRMRNRLAWVALENGRAAGFIQLEPPDHIDMTYVHPEYQRRGVATALLAVLEAEARRRGAGELHVEASITSRPFFLGRGYETVVPQIVRVRGQDFLNYRMRKRLV